MEHSFLAFICWEVEPIVMMVGHIILEELKIGSILVES